MSTPQAPYLWAEYAKGRGLKKGGGGEEEATACLQSLGRAAFTPVSLKNAEGKRINACNHMLP